MLLTVFGSLLPLRERATITAAALHLRRHRRSAAAVPRIRALADWDRDRRTRSLPRARSPPPAFRYPAMTASRRAAPSTRKALTLHSLPRAPAPPCSSPVLRLRH